MSIVRSAKKSWGKIRKNFAVKIIKFLVAIAAILVLTELGLRLVGYMLLHSKTPNINQPSLSEAYYFIICFGDSFTAGSGASSSRFSYPSQLERILDSRYPGKKFLVVNEGLAGLNSSEIIRRMKERLPLYPRKPDLIIVTLFHNNRWNLHLCPTLMQATELHPVGKLRLEKLEKLRIGKLAIILIERVKNLANRSANTNNKEATSAPEGDWSGTSLEPLSINTADCGLLKSWIKYDMLEIKNVAKAQGSEVLFALYHTSWSNNIIRENAPSLSLPYCDAPKDGFWWFNKGLTSKDNWHPNDRGYVAFAEHIADCLESKGFIPKRPDMQ